MARKIRTSLAVFTLGIVFLSMGGRVSEADIGDSVSVVDDFIRICGESDLNMSVIQQSLSGDGWTSLSKQEVDSLFSGVKPRHRSGLVHNHYNFVILLSSQGEITSQQRRMIRGGISVESAAILAGQKLPDALNKRPFPIIGSKNCRLIGPPGSISEMTYMLSSVEMLDGDFGGLKRMGKRGIWTSAGEVMDNFHAHTANGKTLNVSILRQKGGSYKTDRISLDLGDVIPVDQNPSAYEVN